MTKAKMWAIAFLEFVLGCLLSSDGPIRLHSEDVNPGYLTSVASPIHLVKSGGAS
jgi:hypothetical protein